MEGQISPMQNVLQTNCLGYRVQWCYHVRITYKKAFLFKLTQELNQIIIPFVICGLIH